MQFRLAVAQPPALRLQLFQPFAGLILTGACLERGTHRAQQIVAVERSRQEHRIVERVDPVRFRPTPLRARLVGQHDEGQVGPRRLQIDRGDQFAEAGTAQRLFRDQHRPHTAIDARQQVIERGHAFGGDFLTRQQILRDRSVVAMRHEDDDARPCVYPIPRSRTRHQGCLRVRRHIHRPIRHTDKHLRAKGRGTKWIVRE